LRPDVKSFERSPHGELPAGFAQSYGAHPMWFRKFADVTPS
jgi:hypothetical protein